ncbi:MAG TPA: hypothetical protein VKQ70_05645 [Caulobacteraceae bacterium]|jgi:hypothetical protein|nr:hypothetical protein [Caulobacteraceae bacterium]
MIAKLSHAFCLSATATWLAFASPPAALARPNGGDPVAQICASVIGLAPGEKHFAACAQSLAESLHNLRQGEGYAMARRACLGRGLRPNTPGLAQCELTATPADDPQGPALDTAVPGGARSYFLVSRDVAFRRDQLACAKLGFDPAQNAFADCASDLRAALARASEPAM